MSYHPPDEDTGARGEMIWHLLVQTYGVDGASWALWERTCYPFAGWQPQAFRELACP